MAIHRVWRMPLVSFWRLFAIVLTGTEFAVRVSYLELYNEELFDLLSNSDNVESGMRLKLFEGNDKALVIQNLSENAVRTKHEVYKVLAKGTAKRKTAETQMNAHSSR